MSEGHLNIPEPMVLPNTAVVVPHIFVGDEGFPLKPNLMRPYPGMSEIFT